MLKSVDSRKLRKKLLIITSSGGSGHLQAAKAKEQEAYAKDPSIDIVRKNLLKECMGTAFGQFCSESWNRAQRKGDVKALKFYTMSQCVFDYMCWLPIFFWSLKTLFNEEIDEVIDTQPIGTTAIIKAIRIYNAHKNKTVRLEKVVADLPTKKATHFFRPIRKLSKKDRSFLKLTTLHPLLEDGETREEFWQKNCRLSEHEVNYAAPVVRQAFHQLKEKSRNLDVFPIYISCKTKAEMSLIDAVSKKGKISVKKKGLGFYFQIPAQARVLTVLLGSHPAKHATLQYVKKFTQICQEFSSVKQPIFLFVFCSEYKPEEENLFHKIAQYVEKLGTYSPYFCIVPFSFQIDEGIASLFYRSDLTCTRSGGQTAMELMSVAQGEVWIHSETKKVSGNDQSLSVDQLLQGIPGWEAANAQYLQKIKGAKIVTPDICTPFLRAFLTHSKS